MDDLILDAVREYLLALREGGKIEWRDKDTLFNAVLDALCPTPEGVS